MRPSTPPQTHELQPTSSVLYPGGAAAQDTGLPLSHLPQLPTWGRSSVFVLTALMPLKTTGQSLHSSSLHLVCLVLPCD